MSHKIFFAFSVVALILAASVMAVDAQGPQPRGAKSPAALAGTAFTYQGQLKKSGGLVTSSCNFQFGLWDASTLGAQVGATQTVPSLAVTNGLFTTPIDFGSAAFNGDARWLQTRVQCTGDGSYTALAPRQALSPAPMAFALPGMYTQQNAISPNIIGGYSGNLITPTLTGATIGGGGEFGQPNRAWSSYATVGGGLQNTSNGYAATIGGGYANSAKNLYATVGGGLSNSANNEGATVGGGGFNGANAQYSTIGGGSNNFVNTQSSTIGGGNSNFANAQYSTIGGGYLNTTSGVTSTVSGGGSNTASNMATTVGGGNGNNASGIGATISGGFDSAASGYVAVVGGGNVNNASGNNATIGGGYLNTASGTNATVSGGTTNTASATNATIAGGANNQASQIWTTVSGGITNTASGEVSTIAGGNSNTAGGSFSSIGGGTGNTASGHFSTIAGGNSNTASGYQSTVSGGEDAVASHYGEMAFAGGRFAAFGDAQASTYVLRNNTTDSTPTEIYLDGNSASQRVTIASGRTVTFDILVVARRGNGDSAGYRFVGVIENVGGATAIVGAVVKTVLGENDSTWDANVTADNTNDSIKIAVTGPAANVFWVAVVHTVEVAM